MKFVFATVVLYIAKTYPQNPDDKIIPPIKPGKPDFLKAYKTFNLYVNNKNILTINIKNNDLQNRICQRVAPSNDFTISPPKLRLHAPKNTSKGPGNLFIKFIIIPIQSY